MTKTLSMVSHKKYNLSANEGFVIFLTSKSIAWFIGAFTLKMKSQPIAYLLNESEHIYWIWDLECEVRSVWDLWICGLEECEGNGFFEVGRAGGRATVFGQVQKIKIKLFMDMRLPLPKYSSPK
jgi:hypothetical protein